MQRKARGKERKKILIKKKAHSQHELHEESDEPKHDETCTEREREREDRKEKNSQRTEGRKSDDDDDDECEEEEEEEDRAAKEKNFFPKNSGPRSESPVGGALPFRREKINK